MRYIYKCRLCGKEDANLHRGNSDEESQMMAISDLVSAIHGKEIQIMGPMMLSLHRCGNGETGIADLLGAKKEV